MPTFHSSVATFQDNSTHGEDSYLIRDLGNDNFLDAVMDGVTGHGGEEASQSVLEALSAATLASPEDVVAVLEEINQEFFQVGGGRFLLTTVSVALYLDGHLHVISAGDSPVYVINAKSHQQLSGRVGGFLHVGVAQAIGATDRLKNLRRVEADIEPGTRLVLATDGVSDNLTVAELVESVRNSSTPDDASQRINDAVAARIEEGVLPEALGGRFRHDDRTAIFRFFGS